MSGMTKIQFYGGYETPGKFFWEDLYKSFKSSRKAYLLTYEFGKTDGLIKACIVGKEFIRLLVDEEGFNDPDSLQEVFRLSEENPHKFEVKLNRANKLFHPKLYFFTNGSKKTVFLGSSNLTNAGLSRNIETNVRLTGLDKTTITKIEQFCENLWKGAEPLTAPLVKKLKKRLKNRQNRGDDENRHSKDSSEDRYNLPPCLPLSKIIKHFHAKRRRKKGSWRRRQKSSSDPGEFERLIKTTINSIKKERGGSDWKKRSYDQIKSASKIFLKNPTKQSMYEFIETKEFSSRFRPLSSTLKRINSNGLKKLMLSVPRFKQGDVSVLEESAKIKHLGPVFPTVLLHLCNPRKYNILVRANKILPILNRFGYTELPRNSTRVERYLEFNKWAKQHKLKVFERDVFIASII